MNLSTLNKTTCMDKPKADVSQPASRSGLKSWHLTHFVFHNLTILYLLLQNHSLLFLFWLKYWQKIIFSASFFRKVKSPQKQQSVSPLLPKADFLQPKPPLAAAPHNRAALLGKTRHRTSLKATQVSGSSPIPAPLQRLESETSHNHPVPQINSAFAATVQSFSHEPLVGSATCRNKDRTMPGHSKAALTAMIPVPPAGQRESSRGQRVGRRLELKTQKGNPLSATLPIHWDQSI